MDTGQSRGQREGLGVLGGWREAAEQGSGPALMLPSAEEVEVVSHVPVTLERPFIPGLGSWPCPLPPPPPPALLTFFFFNCLVPIWRLTGTVSSSSRWSKRQPQLLFMRTRPPMRVL